MKPIIFGFLGTELSPEEISFFKASDPFGFILFQRNIESPEQVKTLIAQVRAAVGRPHAPFFIDEEGGRVARLKPPHWPALCSMGLIGKIYEGDPEKGREAMRLQACLTAHRLYELDIICTFAPVLDLRIEGASDVIGDRSFGASPERVAELGRIACDTYLENGVLPCIKHLPGHGRMEVDPHHELPPVTTPGALLRAEDFKPFIALNDIPLGMTSHGIFTALDPELPVSISPKIHQEIIREEIGFQGILITDDLAMKALSPSYGENARKALEAGSDIALHGWGRMAEMQDIDASLGAIKKDLLRRWGTALKLVKKPPAAYDPAEDYERLKALEEAIK